MKTLKYYQHTILFFLFCALLAAAVLRLLAFQIPAVPRPAEWELRPGPVHEASFSLA